MGWGISHLVALDFGEVGELVGFCACCREEVDNFPAADEQGPPPLSMCTPIPSFPAWDQRTPYRLIQMDPKSRFCKDPVLSPLTDDDLMKQTLAVVERRNVFGVLSGPASFV